MNKRIGIAILALALLFSWTGLAVAESELKVTGSATVRVEPDLVILRLGVEEKNLLVTEAQGQCNARVNAIVEALTAAGVEKLDISTDSYSIYGNYEYNYETGRSEQMGYVASCYLAVKVRDVARAGELIDAAFAAGANQMGSIDFTLQDSSEAEDKALELAVKDGMRKAGVIAAAANVQLPALPDSIEESNNYSYNAANNGLEMRAVAAAGDTSTSIQTGMLSITANVVLTYDLD